MQTEEIPVDKLPSRGITYPFSYITLPKLKFSTIMEYQSDLSACNNELSKFIVQMKYLLGDLPSFGDLLMYDAIPLMAIRTYSSATSDISSRIQVKYTCPVHNRMESLEVDLSTMEFNDMDPKLAQIDYFRLSGVPYSFRIPKVREFIQVADHFRNTLPLKDKVATRMIWILSMFKEVLDKDKKLEILKAVNDATSENDDINTLNYLYSKLTDAFKFLKATCKQGGEEVKVLIPVIEPLTAYFLDISSCRKVNDDVFSYKTKV